MPLQKQNINISFNGLNSKIDSKQQPVGTLKSLQNAVLNVQGLIEKRYGLDLLDNSITSSNDKISNGEALSSFKKQLLLFDGAKAYSRFDFNDQWIDKGNVNSIINSSYQVVRNDENQANVVVAKVDGLECYVYTDATGIRYTIVESSTKNFIVNNKLLSNIGSNVKVFALEATSNVSSQFIITFTTSSFIKFARVYTNTTYLNSPVYTLTSDLHENNVYDGIRSLSKVNDDVIDKIYITYSARYDANNVYRYPRSYAIDATSEVLYSFDLTTDTKSIEYISVTNISDPSNDISAEVGTTSAMIYSDGYDLFIAKLPEYIGALSPVTLNLPSSFNLSELSQLVFAWNNKTYTTSLLFDVFASFNHSSRKILKHFTLNADINGEVTSASNLTLKHTIKDVELYSKVFNYNNKNYVVATYESDLQSTYFVLNSSLEVVSKANQGVAGGHRTSMLADIAFDGYDFSRKLSSTTNDIYLQICNGRFICGLLRKSRLQAEDGELFTENGVCSFTFDYSNDNTFLSTTSNDSLYTIGGILQSYDGNNFTEAGFHIYPEDLTYDDSFWYVNTTTQGSGVASEVTSVTCTDGYRISPGSYWLINSALNIRQYYVWYKVDGVGSDPNVSGRTGILVNVKSYYTSSQIANITKNVINLYYDDFIATSSNNIITITNTIPGVTSNSSIGNMTVGSISAGTYRYIAVFRWIDNQGRLHRSTTSIPLSVVLSDSSQTITIRVKVLSLTKKSDVVCELYRTENLGAVYYKTAQASNIISNNDDELYINIIDSTSDANLISNELLYTTGQILDNDSPQPCSIITNYKNRLFMAGLDNKNLLAYSKLNTPDQKDFATGFSDLFTIELSQVGGDISGLFPLDDKLIIFKERSIYFINGDGPNNTGAGGSFTEPQLITSDVGCTNPNTIVAMPNGLMFKSNKGIYLLDRGMNVSYVGAPVEEYNDYNITSGVLLNEVNQVRFTTSQGVGLIYNYFFNQWSTFTNYSAVDCDVFEGKFVLLRSNGDVCQESNTYVDESSKHIPLIVETPDFSLAGINGFQRIYRALILGEYKGSHTSKISFAYNYSPIYTDSTTFDGYDVIGKYTYGYDSPYGETNGLTYGGDYIPYQFRIHLKQQKCTAVRIKIEDLQTSNYNEGYNLSAITLQLGVKSTPYKLPSNKSLGSE